MALIRQVVQHPTKKCWAYVEASDEGGLETILGGKEFETKEEAVAYSEGFEPFSYEWVDPRFTRLKNLNAERSKLVKRLAEIDDEIANG